MTALVKPSLGQTTLIHSLKSRFGIKRPPGPKRPQSSKNASGRLNLRGRFSIPKLLITQIEMLSAADVLE